MLFTVCARRERETYERDHHEILASTHETPFKRRETTPDTLTQGESNLRYRAAQPLWLVSVTSARLWTEAPDAV